MWLEDRLDKKSRVIVTFSASAEFAQDTDTGQASVIFQNKYLGNKEKQGHLRLHTSCLAR